MSDTPPRDPLCAYLLRQAENNRWSNHRLLSACAALPEAACFAARPSFFGSIHKALDHILQVDWLYLGRLTGQVLLPPDTPDPMHETLANLMADQTRADAALIAFCAELTPARTTEVVRFHLRNGDAYAERTADVLAHLFQHQIHHRGQVHDMLSATVVAPPQLDEFFMAGDAVHHTASERGFSVD